MAYANIGIVLVAHKPSTLCQCHCQSDHGTDTLSTTGGNFMSTLKSVHSQITVAIVLHGRVLMCYMEKAPNARNVKVYSCTLLHSCAPDVRCTCELEGQPREC